MIVKNLIKRNVIIIKPTCTIKEAAQIMVREGVGILPIVDNDNKPIAVVSERDLIKAIAYGLSIDTNVIEIATKNVITINENESISKAAKLMKNYKIRHLVVVNNEGKVVGVISIRDVISEKNVLKFLAETPI